MFLLYSPLNQGLKPVFLPWKSIDHQVFLLYSPLNQGLKLNEILHGGSQMEQFLLYSPLNQGLKQGIVTDTINRIGVFTLQSIKSRIETFWKGMWQAYFYSFYSTVH